MTVYRRTILGSIIAGSSICITSLIGVFLAGYWHEIPVATRESLFWLFFFLLAIGSFIPVIIVFVSLRTFRMGMISEVTRNDLFLSTVVFGVTVFFQFIALSLFFVTTCAFAFIVSWKITVYIFTSVVSFYLADFMLLIGPLSLYIFFWQTENIFLRYPRKVYRDLLGMVDNAATNKEIIAVRLEEVRNYLKMAKDIGSQGSVCFLERGLILLQETLEEHFSLGLSDLSNVIVMLECVRKVGVKKDLDVVKTYVEQLLVSTTQEEMGKIPSILSSLLEEVELQYSTRFRLESRYASIRSFFKLAVATMASVTAIAFALFPESLKENVLQTYAVFFLFFVVFLLPLGMIYTRIKKTYNRMFSWEAFFYIISRRNAVAQVPISLCKK